MTLHDRLRAAAIGDVVRLAPDEARAWRGSRGLSIHARRAASELPEYNEQTAGVVIEHTPIYFELDWRPDGSADARRTS